MNEQVKAYVDRFPPEIVDLFARLRQLVMDSVPFAPQETLWARLPSYCAGERFVRLIPFKDHINIEARAALRLREELKGYKMTPKGMVQIYVGQSVPRETLARIFAQTLTGQDDA